MVCVKQWKRFIRPAKMPVDTERKAHAGTQHNHQPACRGTRDYGTQMRQWSCTGGDIQYGTQVSGGDALVQRHEHMLDTSVGDLVSDVEWGIGMRELLGRTTSEVDTTSLAAVYRAQHLRDPETSEVDGTIGYDGKKLSYAAKITGTDGVTSELALVVE